MEDKHKLKLKYKKLVHSGKKKDAQDTLKKIWAVSKKSIEDVVDKKPRSIKKAKKKVSEIFSLSDLTRIKGIGKKTVKDIEVMFKDVESLKVALVEKRVALRDDVVKKLEEEFGK
jgi:predicted flap endonuclease-1-like 5' DNA nuclease